MQIKYDGTGGGPRGEKMIYTNNYTNCHFMEHCLTMQLTLLHKFSKPGTAVIFHIASISHSDRHSSITRWRPKNYHDCDSISITKTIHDDFTKTTKRLRKKKTTTLHHR